MLGSVLQAFLLRPIKSQPLLSAACFGWTSAWLIDELLHRRSDARGDTFEPAREDEDVAAQDVSSDGAQMPPPPPRTAHAASAFLRASSLYQPSPCSAAAADDATGQPRPAAFVGWPDRPCLLRWAPGVDQRPKQDAATADARGLPMNNGRCSRSTGILRVPTQRHVSVCLLRVGMHVCTCSLLLLPVIQQHASSFLRLAALYWNTDMACCCSCRPIPVNTDLFEGEVRVWIAGLPTTPDGFATEVPCMTCCCDGSPELTLRAVEA